MSWITITDTDLEDTKLAPLLDALRSAALGSGQGDPVAALLETVIQRVRTELAAGGHALSADTAKVPPSLKRLVTRLALWDAKGRLELEVTKQEETDHRDDLNYLKRLAEGTLGVELPDDPMQGEVSSGAGAVVVERRDRIAKRSDLDGLL